MSEVTLFEEGGAAKAAEKFRSMAMEKAQGDGKPFMKLTKQGQWLYGPEAIEVGEDELWAINPLSIKVGYIGWKDGGVVGEQMFPFLGEERVDPNTLPPIDSTADGDGWRAQMSVELKNLDDGTEVVYKTTSYGGEQAFATLSAALASQIEENPQTPVPVVQLKTDSYKHQRYGKIFNPVLEIIEWRDINGDSPKPLPKGRQRKKLV